jgi:hypothetical protein
LLVIDVWGIGKSWEIWIKKGKFLEYQPRVGDNSFSIDTMKKSINYR